MVHHLSKSGDVVAQPMYWGLLPHGTASNPHADGKSKFYASLQFNARSEDLKPTFQRLLLQSKTAVVALDGFYEWKTDQRKEKQPYYITRSGGAKSLLVAGFWNEVATGFGSDTVKCFTVLTTAASDTMSSVHTRMPVVLRDAREAMEWLGAGPKGGMQLLERISVGCTQGANSDGFGLEYWPVTKKINKASEVVEDPTRRVKLEDVKSVRDFFASVPVGLKTSPAKSLFETTKVRAKGSSSKAKATSKAKPTVKASKSIATFFGSTPKPTKS